jgi:hypothetical protein
MRVCGLDVARATRSARPHAPRWRTARGGAGARAGERRRARREWHDDLMGTSEHFAVAPRSSLHALGSAAAAMSRVLAAALALAAARGACAHAPTLVLASAPALGGAPGGGDAPGGVAYESVTQAELAAGVLRAAGGAPAQPAGWEARHWAASGADAPQLLAVLLSDAAAAREARGDAAAACRAVALRLAQNACSPLICVPLCSQELRAALAGAPTSLALPNAAAAAPGGLAAALGQALAAARAAGGAAGSLLLSDSCGQARAHFCRAAALSAHARTRCTRRAAVRVPRRSHAQLHARARAHLRIGIRACAALVSALCVH